MCIAYLHMNLTISDRAHVFLNVLTALQQEAEVIFEDRGAETEIKFSNVYLIN